MARFRWTTHREQYDSVGATIKFELRIIRPFICFPPAFLPGLVTLRLFIFQ